jgi:phospholipid-binding lipoprotein MlaA
MSVKKIVITVFLLFYMQNSALAITNKANNKQSPSQEVYTPDDMFYEEDFQKYSEKRFRIYDPFEKMNRKIFSFNEILDRYFFKYVALTYRHALPKPVRNSVRNFVNNLTLPISAFNSFLQGKTENGLATFSNFLINSTIGLGGLFDPAGSKNIRYNYEDFSQTFGHYSASSGAYLVIPFLGPSSVRDLSGLVVEKIVDPLSVNAFNVGGKYGLITQFESFELIMASKIDAREGIIEILDEERRDSFDLYATLRSAYLQKRAAEARK